MRKSQINPMTGLGENGSTDHRIMSFCFINYTPTQGLTALGTQNYQSSIPVLRRAASFH